MTAERPTRGISLIEVLVIAALIAVCVAWLLPALGTARERARRAKCSENLREIGTGILAYATAHDHFPISFIANDRKHDNCGTSDTSYFGHTWMTFILPQMGEHDAYNAINFERTYNVTDQQTAFGSTIGAYLCPADTRSAEVRREKSFRTMQVSYSGVRGLTETFLFKSKKENADRCYVIDSEGIFGATNLAYRPRDVTDGQSNTVMVGEVSRFLGEPPGSNFNFGNVGHLWEGPPWGTDPAWPGDKRITAVAFTIPTINAKPLYSAATACITSTGPHLDEWGKACRDLGQWGFRSNHPNGASFAFGDGSVRFIRQTIVDKTYQALGTRNGSEPLERDEY